MAVMADIPATVLKRITARKYGGDDSASWAVFVDGRPVITGLTKSELPYYRKQVAKRLAKLSE